MEWAGLVPLFPLIGFLAISLGRKAIGKKLAGWLGTAMIAASFLVSILLFLNFTGQPVTVNFFHWFSAGKFSVDFSFLIDQLSLVMLLMVTGVGLLIHIYSMVICMTMRGLTGFFLTSTFSCFLCFCW